MKNPIKLISAIVLVLAFSSCEKEILVKKLHTPTTGEQIPTNTWHTDQIGSDNNTFDIYCPFSEEKTPLIIAIHGGYFLSGDKRSMRPNESSARLSSNWISQHDIDSKKMAYATINYSLVSNESSYGIVKPLQDCKNMLDYFRENSDFYNIDPDKIILFGASAGASTSLWLGLQDERIKGIVCINPQASLVFHKWHDDIFLPCGYPFFWNTNININQITDLSKKLYKEGIPSGASNLHLLNLIDETDPEIYLINNADKKDFMHHISHTLIIEKVANNRGNKAKIYEASNQSSQNSNWESIIDFCERTCIE